MNYIAVVQGGGKTAIAQIFMSITILAITILQNVEDPVTVLKRAGEMSNPVLFGTSFHARFDENRVKSQSFPLSPLISTLISALTLISEQLREKTHAWSQVHKVWGLQSTVLLTNLPQNQKNKNRDCRTSLFKVTLKSLTRSQQKGK